MLILMQVMCRYAILVELGDGCVGDRGMVEDGRMTSGWGLVRANLQKQYSASLQIWLMYLEYTHEGEVEKK